MPTHNSGRPTDDRATGTAIGQRHPERSLGEGIDGLYLGFFLRAETGCPAVERFLAGDGVSQAERLMKMLANRNDLNRPSREWITIKDSLNGDFFFRLLQRRYS
jgi:hypothetical protein